LPAITPPDGETVGGLIGWIDMAIEVVPGGRLNAE
jgi:hypothetical protein